MALEEFRDEEIDFIGDQKVIATKNRLTKKIIHHLEHLRSFLADNVDSNPFPGISFPTGKISKGENHQGFPYLVLDYPAILRKEDIFALRTIVWWGNHISNVFLIKGKYLSHFQNAFLKKSPNLSEKRLFFTGDTPWIHEINKKYVPCKKLKEEDIAQQINKNGFIKIVEVHDFVEINNLNSITGDFIEGIRKVLY